MRGKGGGPENGNEQKRDRTVTVEGVRVGWGSLRAKCKKIQ